jgi:hypothetical protein
VEDKLVNTLKKQRGLSFLTWFIILSMAGVMVITGIKLTPVYIQYYTIAKILEQMQTEPSLKGVQRAEIIASFNKRLDVSEIELPKGSYKITQVEGKNGYLLEVEYEERRPLFGNLSIVASFKRSAEVGG